MRIVTNWRERERESESQLGRDRVLVLMGRKKKKTPRDGSSSKPDIWCFYCDRTFKSEKTLIDHQRIKHFKCVLCNKRVTTASGLVTHVTNVHKVRMYARVCVCVVFAIDFLNQHDM